ncbi:unnamed protein product [Camellia sinensis]
MKMSALQGVFSIVGAIAGRLVEPVMLHVGFAFQYKKKQENLEVEIKNLEELIEQIKEKVDEAITRGEEVDEPVSNWLAEVEERVPKFKDENIVNENMQCSVFLCPDYISRYRMSKEAENKIEEVKKFTQSGNFSIVAHPKPFAQELQFTSSSTNYVNFESRELVFNNIMAALQNSNVKMIGVYGIGGVGKTTMVEEIGKLVKNRLFDEVVVAVVSQDANVSNIQGQLAVRLNLELQGETHEVGKASKLWNRLNNGKKNLIILDDMWQNLDLKRIGIPIIDGSNCCKVVMTSRIQGVLEEMHVDRYVPMQVLSKKEAWALFKTKVGNSVDSPELHDIADAVCKECGGLPVTILAVGAALKYKKKYVWEDVLDQFKDSMLKNIAGIDAKVYASLKLSYDRLESSDAKSCFLLCCFFPEDANISLEVLAQLHRICMLPPLSLANLVNLWMLWLDDCKLGDIAILKDLNNNLEILSLRGSNIEVLPSEIGQLTRLQLLDLGNCYKLREIPQGVISNLSRLEELYILDEFGYRQERSKVNLDDLEIKSFHKLAVVTFPTLETLQIKRLKKIIEIWDRKLLPSESFQQLRNVTIKSCKKLVNVGSSNMPQQLPKLKRLEVSQCQELKVIVLKNGGEEEEKAENNNNTNSFLQLTSLTLEDLQSLKSFFTSRSETQSLFTSQVTFPALERLQIKRLTKITKLWDRKLLPSESFQQLRNVAIKSCQKLANVGSSNMPRQLTKQEQLEVSQCRELKVIILKNWREEEEKAENNNNTNSFLQLKSLTLENLKSLKSFFTSRSETQSLFTSQVTFPALERLQIKRLTKITEIWDRKLLPSESFQQLRNVTIKSCQKLVNASECRELKVIVLKNEGEEEEKAENNNNTNSFLQLTSLRLEDLQSLKSFFTSRSETQSLFTRVTFPALETLQIKRLTKITEIWDRKLLPSESFQQLRNVTIKSCQKLVNVGSSNMPRQLPKLKQLEVGQCQDLKVMVLKNGGEEEEKAENKPTPFSPLDLKHNPSSLARVTFPALVRLQIKRLTKITEIWDRKLLPSESFQQLRNMTIKSCQKVVNVGSSNMPRQLPKLKRLEVSQCRELKVIVLKNEGEEEEKAENNNNTNSFLQLTILRLEDLQSLKSFFTSRSETQSLFTSQVAFPVLVYLKIQKLPTIIQIWDKQLLIALEKESKSFYQLKGMTVFDCEKLEHVVQFNMLPRLQNLNIFRVYNCPKVEVVVSEKEKEEGTTNINDIIVFSQLTTLNLYNLVNLRSFYNWPTRSEAQPLFNHQ